MTGKEKTKHASKERRNGINRSGQCWTGNGRGHNKTDTGQERKRQNAPIKAVEEKTGQGRSDRPRYYKDMSVTYTLSQK